MTEPGVKRAIVEARRFIKVAEVALADRRECRIGPSERFWYLAPGRKSAAARRASMDLTRALSDMRRPR